MHYKSSLHARVTQGASPAARKLEDKTASSEIRQSIEARLFLGFCIMTMAVSAPLSLSAGDADTSFVRSHEGVDDGNRTIVNPKVSLAPMSSPNRAYTTIEELISNDVYILANNSALVAVARLIESTRLDPRGNGSFHTHYAFVIEDIIKGQFAGARLEVDNLGGVDSSKDLVFSTPYSFRLKKGERYLLFLRPNYDRFVLPFLDVYSVSEDGRTIADAFGRRLSLNSSNGATSRAVYSQYAILKYVNRPDYSIPALTRSILKPIGISRNGRIEETPVPSSTNSASKPELLTLGLLRSRIRKEKDGLE